jgi:hypothetical protein|tara:strand:+ start:1554 stop:1964 length:411 start_codon:yes stop_codon:yes gene_type:complete
MILDEKPIDLADEMDFIGDKIMWPSATPPANLRGYHDSEIIDIALRRGVALVHYTPNPYLRGDTMIQLYEYKKQMVRFLSVLSDRRAILRGNPTAVSHAVAWDGSKIFDPSRNVPCRMSEISWSIQYALIAFPITG